MVWLDRKPTLDARSCGGGEHRGTDSRVLVSGPFFLPYCNMSETSAQASSSAAFAQPGADTSQKTEQSNDSSRSEEDDDDEKLFAELDEELDMMEDEPNYDGFSRSANGNDDTVASFDMAEFRERRMQEIRQE